MGLGQTKRLKDKAVMKLLVMSNSNSDMTACQFVNLIFG